MSFSLEWHGSCLWNKICCNQQKGRSQHCRRNRPNNDSISQQTKHFAFTVYSLIFLKLDLTETKTTVLRQTKAEGDLVRFTQILPCPLWASSQVLRASPELAFTEVSLRHFLVRLFGECTHLTSAWGTILQFFCCFISFGDSLLLSLQTKINSFCKSDSKVHQGERLSSVYVHWEMFHNALSWLRTINVQPYDVLL